MNPETLNELKLVIRNIEEHLVDGNYKNVGSESGKSNLTAEEIKTTIEKYPRNGKLTISPLSELDKTEPVEIKNSPIQSWFIDHQLWFDNRPSDLTLQLKANLHANKLEVVIEDIHIL